MKNEKLIVGLIITAIGLVLLYFGYQKMQPDTIERGLNMLNDLSKSFGGEKMPIAYQKDRTEAIIIMIVGGILSVIGLRFILKSRE
ncbi:MAG: hypothetical protein Q8T08_08760 [Ignavibacteria bacterium]|nr:hypothetical protein [Ignavibacteria bacterium]